MTLFEFIDLLSTICVAWLEIRWLARHVPKLYFKLREASSWGLAGGWIMLTRVWLPGMVARARWWISRRRRGW